MQVFTTVKDINNEIVRLKSLGKEIGFVPTMGALHDGHLSLIRRSNKENDITVCSVFVNPTQFNDPEDFEKYPSVPEQDLALLSKARCDLVFLPAVAEMYPDGYQNKDPLSFGFMAETLEGEHRPGHFSGMAQIVEKLLGAVVPDRLYMGQKDYQQALICGKLIRIRKMKTILITCPIKREKDGLAMSSRNLRLDKHSREKAVEIVKTLRWIKRQIRLRHSVINSALTDHTENAALQRLSSFPEFKVEYIAIRQANDLKKVSNQGSDKPLVALIAAQIGGVRLIDNMLI